MTELTVEATAAPKLLPAVVATCRLVIVPVGETWLPVVVLVVATCPSVVVVLPELELPTAPDCTAEAAPEALGLAVTVVLPDEFGWLEGLALGLTVAVDFGELVLLVRVLALGAVVVAVLLEEVVAEALGLTNEVLPEVEPVDALALALGAVFVVVLPEDVAAEADGEIVIKSAPICNC